MSEIGSVTDGSQDFGRNGAKYAGKRVVITGGASGVGLATAKLLLGRGARVMVTAHTSQDETL